MGSVHDVADVWTVLRARARTSAGAPLVTYLDPARGERVELSAVSVENAAAKIANALRDTFDLEAGATVGLHLPVHWQRAAWCAGAWTAGCVVVPEGTDVDLLVSGPDEAAALASRGRVAVVSLHPFGLPLDGELPPGAEDVTVAVRQQPDAYLYEPPDAGSAALLTEDGVVDQGVLLERARDLGVRWGLETGGRLLADDAVRGTEAWLAALAVPLACSAATVLVRGDGAAAVDPERITARATSA